jgi:glycolate oxidase
LEKTFGFPVACFGHAGDGNIHVNLMVDLKQSGTKKKCDRALDALFKKVIELGGAITGEHGIGLAKKPWWPIAASRSVRKVHRAIKGALDPHHTLNPGKFL